MNLIYNKEYSHIRGFNIHGDWCYNGATEWLQFDAEHYKKMINLGKERFPGMNTVRVWLSHEAYMVDKDTYLKAVKTAGEILTEAGLQIIPIYFNGWFSIPAYGGFTLDCLYEGFMPSYINFAKDTAKALLHANVLMNDISNEPYNSICGSVEAFDKISDFLIKMIETVREIDDRKITVGVQGHARPDNPRVCDIARLAPYVDVISLHPYNGDGLSTEEYEKFFRGLVEYVETFKKPYLITECVWGAPDAEGRRIYLESELSTYAKYQVGFLAHELFTSPVADCGPIDRYGYGHGLYMAFLDEEFHIRKYHDIFNEYAKV